MIRFLFKGLLRDKQRSLLPIIVVIIGVFLTVLMHTWIKGVFGDVVDFNAKFATGHVKIMTRGYSDKLEQLPNDLALTGVDDLLAELAVISPDIQWSSRIRFGGLVDVPDENNETKTQGPAVAWGIDLLTPGSPEAERMKIPSSIIRGRIPEKPGEILLSEDFAKRLEVEPGQIVTFFGSTMLGGMAMQNFILAGTVRFGTQAVDRGALVMDLEDARLVLDMPDAAGEVLGFFPSGLYEDDRAKALVDAFAERYHDQENLFEPTMVTLRDQNDLGSIVDYMDVVTGLISFIFILAMSLVLWNAGLLGGLRRYGEVGLRLAMGESKGQVYRSMLGEAVLIGLVGSVIGTALALGISYWLQNNGIDLSGMMKGASMMLPSVFRTQVTTPAFYVGFLPGLFATVIGTGLAGIGIYKRKTAQLFKELE
ncbi:MAG: FtsX-like permease family protein [Bacteroidales bacterium]|jgi:putative ABC transport system permease protein|nr:FtsX-like permease family protein [Bacteroidales bacterium]MDD2571351.1 FtsX-like permease family protein [Bacteroidales bacterium]MDD2813253.1 FtsX-like permease family protein [Bacteroidales bacterium]MDD3385335.1 FtsX-like permease family protein [Bacteroidales bacterium]MDD3871812.1 FtsX-like permease family protein [Bacteroidales bacterium]